MSRRIVILANGPAPERAFLRKAAKGAATVLCTDGAFRTAMKAGLRVDVIVGDLDSLESGTAIPRGTRVLFDDDPSLSDLEKSVRLATRSRFASRFGGPEIWILGALGSRLDHSLANLQILEAYASDARILLVDAGGTAELVSGRAAFSAKKGERISLFPAPRAVVTTSGLRYALSKQKLPRGSRGVSNEATGRRVTLKVAGRLLLVRSTPPWA